VGVVVIDGNVLVLRLFLIVNMLAKKNFFFSSKIIYLTGHAAREVELAVARLVGLHVEHDSGCELVGCRASGILNLDDVDRIPCSLHLL